MEQRQTNADANGHGARLLARLAAGLSAHPRLVLGVSGVIALLGAAIAAGLEVNTSRTNLGHATMPSERDFGDFLREFGSPNDLIAVIDAPEVTEPAAREALLRKTADDLATTPSGDGERVRSTYHRVEVDRFLKHLLLFVPAEELGQLGSVLSSEFATAVRAGRAEGLGGMLGELASVVKTRAAADLDVERATRGLDVLSQIAAEVEARLRDPWRQGLVGFRELFYVFPKVPETGAALDGFLAEVGGVAPHATGFPVIYFDSSRSTFRGLMRSSLLALPVVVLAVLLHFRELSATLLTLVPLVVAAVAMPALMRLFGVPHNVANVVALPLLIGMSADYGLQLVHHSRRFPDDTLRAAMAETGLGVFLAGGTTAAGFGALLLAQHHGATSLGGELLLGTLAAMAGALVVLPALLTLERRRAASGRTGGGRA